MLKRVLFTVSKKIRKLMMAETAVSQAVTSEGASEKRSLNDDNSSCPAAKKLKVQPEAPMQGRADRKRKVALLIAYCGAGYYGIQIQMKGDFRTIESEMIKALVAAGLIPQDHADTPQKMSLQRAARTDKNVSAVGNVLSLKMLYHEGVSEKINSHLPPEIRVIGCVRTTQGFDSKNHCTARTYKYMLPTYSFAPVEKFITKDYRLPDGSLQRVNEVLGKYVGTHNFHNFTSGRKPNDPSSKRYIISFESGEPFVREDMEFVILTVKGQSFMLHHIRKMIGLMIAIVRGFCGEDVLKKSWGPHKMDIPKAPGLGLFLHELFFAGYNKKFGNDGMHEPLVWNKYQESLDQFREEHVLSHIATSEVKESVMLQWLGTLQNHKFDVIDPTQEVPPDGENEKDRTWWKTKALLNRLDKEQKKTGTEAPADTGITTTASDQAASTSTSTPGTNSEPVTSSACPEPMVTTVTGGMSSTITDQVSASQEKLTSEPRNLSTAQEERTSVSGEESTKTVEAGVLSSTGGEPTSALKEPVVSAKPSETSPECEEHAPVLQEKSTTCSTSADSAKDVATQQS
ncbi:pseudouridylate synthase 1 homolog [Babylonia areolata]|uniref:pseudouridylate synthase 1 homolog n=1 Tax=Babylonia areolata TaxID=304850 RepID=UPI003FD25441